MARVFGYKGYIGITGFSDSVDFSNDDPLTLSDLTPALINNPLADGQLGFVCRMEQCEFNQEAIDILKTVKKSGDCIGDVDIFDSSDGAVFSWLGGPTTVIGPDSEGSSTYNPSLLPEAVEVGAPEGFKEYVDQLSGE